MKKSCIVTVYYNDNVVRNVHSLAFIEKTVKLFDINGKLLKEITRDSLVSIICNN